MLSWPFLHIYCGGFSHVVFILVEREESICMYFHFIFLHAKLVKSLPLCKGSHSILHMDLCKTKLQHGPPTTSTSIKSGSISFDIWSSVSLAHLRWGMSLFILVNLLSFTGLGEQVDHNLLSIIFFCFSTKNTPWYYKS